MTSTELTQFITLAALCVLVFLAAILKARAQQLNIRYATGWMLLAGFGIAAGALIPLVGPLADALGVAAGVIVFAAATVVLVALMMQLSISLSGALRQNEILAIRHALSNASPISRDHVGEVVIIPAWNEASNIAAVVTDLRHSGHTPVVIDDGSSDRTGEIAESAGATVIRLPFNLGVGAAVRCGLIYADDAGLTRVIQCDADGQHPADRINDLVSQSDATGADIVIGSRFSDGVATQMRIGTTRGLAMRFLAKIVSKNTHSPITDATSGFRLIRQPLLNELANAMPSYYLGDTFESYVAAGRSGYLITEVHAPIRERLSGSSSSSAVSSVLMLIKAMFLVSTRLGIRLHHKPIIDK